MIEIGSEFWDVPVIEEKNSVFPDCAQWYVSGRSALSAIIRELKGVDTVSMPSWCCESMIQPFIDAGIKIKHYPVYFEKTLVQEPDYNSDVILVMDYFGYTSNEISIPYDYKGIVIRDITHSMFSTQYNDASYYFGSLRKWCGFFTGGFAWSNDKHQLLSTSMTDEEYVGLRKKAMAEKSEYIKTQRGDKHYLELFSEAERRLDSICLYAASEEDVERMSQLDVKSIISTRRRNAKLLIQHLSDYSIFKNLNDLDCPLFVPIIVPDGKRMELRNYLIKHSIYCPIHWPQSANLELSKRELFIYKNELSLVCDQRYQEKDMFRIINTIKTFLEG